MLAVCACILLLAVPWLRLAPYFEAYFNSLAGGVDAASRQLTVGTGLGLNEVADYLNRKPEAQNLVVPSYYHFVFEHYFDGQTQPRRVGTGGEGH